MAPLQHNDQNGRGGVISPPPTMPARPRPSADEGIKPPRMAPPDEPDAIPHDVESIDIFTLPPLAAVKILTGFAEALIRRSATHTGENAYNSTDPTAWTQALTEGIANATLSSDGSHNDHHHEDIPQSHKTPIGSPETHPSEHPEAGHGTDQKVPPLDINVPPAEEDDIRFILARKFSAKSVPPVPLIEYLKRLHTYCPMSTAVYLAAGIYLEQLVRGGRQRRRSSGASGSRVDGRDHAECSDTFRLPLHRRNAHRLLLASLRIATKLLEDLSYAHSRFARVGGITERELTRLEINFLFLVEFRTVVDPQEMQRAVKRMRVAALESIEEAIEEED